MSAYVSGPHAQYTPTNYASTVGSMSSASHPYTAQTSTCPSAVSSVSHFQTVVFDSSGTFIQPNVPVQSHPSDTCMTVGSSSLPQGGILPSSANGLMPTGHTVSMNTSAFSQTQGGPLPSSVQGLMIPHQIPSHAYVSHSEFPSQASGGPQPLVAQGLVPPTLSAPIPQGGYVPFSGQGTHANIVSELAYPDSQHCEQSQTYQPIPQTLNQFMPYTQTVQCAPVQQAPQIPQCCPIQALPYYQPTQPLLPEINTQHQQQNNAPTQQNQYVQCESRQQPPPQYHHIHSQPQYQTSSPQVTPHGMQHTCQMQQQLPHGIPQQTPLLQSQTTYLEPRYQQPQVCQASQLVHPQPQQHAVHQQQQLLTDPLQQVPAHPMQPQVQVPQQKLPQKTPPTPQLQQPLQQQENQAMQVNHHDIQHYRVTEGAGMSTAKYMLLQDQEAFSEATSIQSVGLVEDNNDIAGMSDMISVRISVFGSPDISGRDIPFQHAGSDEEPLPHQMPLQEIPSTLQTIPQPTGSHEDDNNRLGMPDITAETEKVETKSALGDTWTTNVLGRDSKSPSESNQRDKVVHNGFLPQRNHAPEVTECINTCVVPSDMEEKQLSSESGATDLAPTMFGHTGNPENAEDHHSPSEDHQTGSPTSQDEGVHQRVVTEVEKHPGALTSSMEAIMKKTEALMKESSSSHTGSGH